MGIRVNYQGKILAAHPKRVNLYLHHGVVLVVEHSQLGAWGLQINFQHSGIDNLGSIINNQGIWSDLDHPVYFGGQFHHNRCFILHSNDWSSETTMKITPELYLSADLYILSALADGQGPRRIRPIVGLHQWSKGELDREVDQNQDHGWLIGTPDCDMIFEQERDQQWQSVLDQATRNIVNLLLN